MTKQVGIWAVGLLVLVVALAAFTKPSRADLHAASVNYAKDNSGLLDYLATGVTDLFGNDSYDDYILFARYRVYIGKNPTLVCYGAFTKSTCGTLKQTTQAAEN